MNEEFKHEPIAITALREDIISFKSILDELELSQEKREYHIDEFIETIGGLEKIAELYLKARK